MSKQRLVQPDARPAVVWHSLASSPLVVIILIMGGLALAPLFVSTYYASDVLAKAMILAILAIGLDLAWGYGGILSLGHSAFFGLGAYAMSIILLRWDSVLAGVTGMAVAITIPAALAAVVGWFVFFGATSTLYVAIVTLALPVLLSAVALRVPGLTGGQTGLSGIPSFPWEGPLTTYYGLLAILCAATALIYAIVRSDYGRFLIAVRDNEQRAQFLGFRTPHVRLGVFALSGGLAGFAGAIYAPYNGFVSHDVLGLQLSTAAIAWVAIGGRGTVAGPLIGAIAINVLEPVLNEAFPGLSRLLLGLVFIFVVLAVPGGLFGVFSTRRPDRRLLEVVSRQDTEGRKRRMEVAVRKLGLSFGSLTVFKDVDLAFRTGHLHCMIGPNGAGKSTLVNVITGLLRPSEGEIVIDGAPAPQNSPASIARLGIVRTFQASNVFETLRVGDNLFLAARTGATPSLIGYSPKIELPGKAAEVFQLSGLDAKLQARAGDLGHGERKWLELCMVLASNPAIIFLDEPTAGLTTADRAKVAPLLVALVHRHGLGLLLIEHDLDFVKSIADRLTVLANGGVLADGAVEEVIRNPEVNQVYLGHQAGSKEASP
jgi:branched-chain amino acid transport system permease protein